jgi:coenzyme F420-0:L-glutamate ligase / coenzyme F420-1:gamma-L-glutamate ligase
MPADRAPLAAPRPYRVELLAIPGLPEVRAGDDVARLFLQALSPASISLVSGDVLAVAQKVISKAEGRMVPLSSVEPGPRARELALQTGKDPRLVELILRESDEISRVARGVLIVRHRLGFTSANAGIDRSNVCQGEDDETVLLLPEDPDASAERLRRTIRDETGADVGVLIVDSHGRPFRLGTVGVSIGVAGLCALWDRRGEVDRHGYVLRHTEVALADEIAAAASLMMGQAAEGTPLVLVRGLRLPPQPGVAANLYRSKELDLYRP